ncbi:carbohydrate porin [Schlegelella sp. S2-27]|uniref:Carbohydrate porin n=1 Tax=Caldimonas mangrovi TaxID=2944811 RepID=A0ABT0YK24_9BURK|nr:carbohydrate porin [Caldimonas mangrovi]
MRLSIPMSAPSRAPKRRLLSGAVLSCVAAAAGAQTSPTLEFSGYARAATGVNSRGGTMVCYQLPGADTKYRLGNECDYVIEPSFVAKLADIDNGGRWYIHLMPSVYRAWGDEEAGTDELTTRFGQAYAYGAGIPQLGNGKVWVGRRFYDRVQLGINDQFLENHDGDGAGIEDVELGVGKFSYAFMMNPRSESAVENRYEHALRYTGIPTFGKSELAVYLGYANTTTSEDQSTDPPTPKAEKDAYTRLGLYHVTKGTLGGNTFVGAKIEKSDDFRQWRAVLQQTGMLDSIRTGWDLIAEYRTKRVSGADEKWYSLGGRTDTHISGPFRGLIELGHDIIKPEDGPTRNLTKLTLAAAVSAGTQPSSRPTIRLFYTYARWNDAARDAINADTGLGSSRLSQVFGDRKSGSSIGAQFEAWW